jgi:hypothetical protein
MPQCQNAPKNSKSKPSTFTGKEASPLGVGYCAKYDKVGTKRTGRDGNKYVVVTYKKWCPVKGQQAGGGMGAATTAATGWLTGAATRIKKIRTRFSSSVLPAPTPSNTHNFTTHNFTSDGDDVLLDVNEIKPSEWSSLDNTQKFIKGPVMAYLLYLGQLPGVLTVLYAGKVISKIEIFENEGDWGQNEGAWMMTTTGEKTAKKFMYKHQMLERMGDILCKKKMPDTEDIVIHVQGGMNLSYDKSNDHNVHIKFATLNDQIVS